MIDTATVMHDLFGVDMALLSQNGLTGGDPCLPGRSTDVLDSVLVGENIFNLFQSLACGFGEHEEDVNEHDNAEDAKEDVGPPLDVDKGRRDEVSQSKIEGPVGGCGERDGLSTDPQGINLGWVDPRNRSPSGGI